MEPSVFRTRIAAAISLYFLRRRVFGGGGGYSCWGGGVYIVVVCDGCASLFGGWGTLKKDGEHERNHNARKREQTRKTK